MNELKWADPPPTTRRGRTSEKKRTLEALKKHPGRWALVAKGASSSTGTTWRKLGADVEVRRRTEPDGKHIYDIYARWPTPTKTREQGAPIPKGSAEEREDHERAELARLPVPENETPGERDARRVAERIAIDRQKRKIPADGAPATRLNRRPSTR